MLGALMSVLTLTSASAEVEGMEDLRDILQDMDYQINIHK